MKKPALLVLGGITYKNYAVGDLLSMPEANHYYKGHGSNLATYGKIEEIDCEQFLDNKITSWFSMFLIIGIPFRLWDRFGDFFKVISNEKVMGEIAIYVESRIKQAIEEYGEVDVIAHSLGTLIILFVLWTTNVRIRNLYLIGSPLTSKYTVIRDLSRKFLINKMDIFQNKFGQVLKVFYCWSANDIVSSTPPDQPDDITQNVDCSDCGHGFKSYLKNLFSEGIIKL